MSLELSRFLKHIWFSMLPSPVFEIFWIECQILAKKTPLFFQNFPFYLIFDPLFLLKPRKWEYFQAIWGLISEKNAKIANFGHFMVTKKSICQIYLKYVPFIDFAGFLVLPNVKKWVQMFWNLVIFAVLRQ